MNPNSNDNNITPQNQHTDNNAKQSPSDELHLLVSTKNVTAPVPGVMPQISINKPHKSRILKYVLIILFVLLSLPILVVFVTIASFMVSTHMKMDKLQTAADSKAQKLERILAKDNRKITAKGVVDGDSLTANSDPNISTFAESSFYNDKSALSDVETRLSTAIKEYGFSRDGGDATPYYQMSSPAYAGYPLDKGNRLIMRYANNDDAMLITYQFDKYYECPTGYVCEKTENSKQTDKIYDIRAFATIPVTKVSISYASKDYYLTQLR